MLQQYTPICSRHSLFTSSITIPLSPLPEYMMFLRSSNGSDSLLGVSIEMIWMDGSAAHQHPSGHSQVRISVFI